MFLIDWNDSIVLASYDSKWNQLFACEDGILYIGKVSPHTPFLLAFSLENMSLFPMDCD